MHSAVDRAFCLPFAPLLPFGASLPFEGAAPAIVSGTSETRTARQRASTISRLRPPSGARRYSRRRASRSGAGLTWPFAHHGRQIARVKWTILRSNR
jgi:hypothetical protein